MAAGRDPERPALALFAAELRAARGHAGLSREDLAPRGASKDLIMKVAQDKWT